LEQVKDLQRWQFSTLWQNLFSTASNVAPDYRAYGGGCTNGTVIYYVGGFGRNVNSTEASIYYPSSNRWINISPMNVGRFNNAAAYYNGYVYAFGGYSPSTGATNSLEYFNVAKNFWTISPNSLLVARQYLNSVVIMNRIFIVGGSDTNGTPINALEEFTPKQAQTEL